jgi:uncharacterized protein YacL
MSWNSPEDRKPSPPRPKKNRYSIEKMSAADDGKERPPSQAAAPAREFWALRALLLVGIAGLCFGLQPFGWPRVSAAVAGFFFAALLLMIERRGQRVAVGSLLGGATGVAAGILVTVLLALVISLTAVAGNTKSVLVCASLSVFGYLGLMLGAGRGAEVLRDRGDARRAEPRHRESLKLLDTSVLIDGRIADICDAHFVDGVIGVPQFVLHELQMVADSGDALKRQRGRRGLEILQRMQKMTHLEMRALEDGVPVDLAVDDKLVELARRTGAKIVTNDFNLNKVAAVHGIAVLNVNLLANAMKPAVLPGEPMRVLILREGKEPSQGVAYLDDGTMVVVDGGRRMINKSVDVIVTSVHQTTAGKMIFGRLDESAEPSPAMAKRAAAAGNGGREEIGNNATEDFPNGGRPGPKLPERSHG